MVILRFTHNMKNIGGMQTQLAREAFGMWSDRDPDEHLARSRVGLTRRDREVKVARRIHQITVSYGESGA